jgi:cobyrinic acid a,c-diamide synthase
MGHLYLSAAHKSSGKTTVAIGLCRALRARGLVVQPFKKGPDYIDPMWTGQAAGRPCINLDFNTQGRGEIQAAFARELVGADIGLVEGNVGLYDSSDLLGHNSNAELAKLLGSPVVLVLDCEGMARGVAPLLLGYRAFDPALRIGGVILNKVGGQRHDSNLRRAIAHYTDLPVLGSVRRNPEMAIAERHLGLMPSNEADASEAWIERIRGLIADQVDLDRLLELAEQGARPQPEPPRLRVVPPGSPLRIGIARDAAFGFYYPDDLRALSEGGAELVPFSPVDDPELPEVDGLFIGGGFPEYRMAELGANGRMRESVRAFIQSGGPAYAECGGLMYLCRSLRWGERTAPMVGVLDAEVEMRPRPQGRGYVRLRETAHFPWPAAAPTEASADAGADADAGTDADSDPREVKAHEFHHSAVIAPAPGWTYAYEVLRGSGIDGRHDGVVIGNLLASYSHLRDPSGQGWTRRFLAHVRRCRG